MKECFLTQNGPRAIGPYSTATISGGTVYLSGVLGIVPETGKLAEGGVEAQAHQVLDNMRAILSELGCMMDDVLKTTVFMKDLSSFAAFNQVYAEYFPANCPARSCVEVSRLPMDALVEVEAIVSR
ncbi:MAG: Rid family detoxifying hydrolase [Candidatus Faecivicinus sp.]|nr:Rid family detoxifying hydrolase [Candidatus Faecivicinus sp.]